MNSSGTQILLAAQTTAATTPVKLVDNDQVILLQVSTDAVTPNSQRLYVYGSIGTPASGGNSAIDPSSPATPANPYSALMLRDLNDLDAIVGTDGVEILANSVKTFEVNVNGIRDLHLKLTGGEGTAVTVTMRPYRNV